MTIAGNDVLCDSATSIAVDKRVAFAVLRNVQLKGWAKPVPVYRPETVLSQQGQKYPSQMIGRDAERATLRDALGNLLRGEGEVVVIQGEAGIGKSVRRPRRHRQGKRMPRISGICDGDRKIDAYTLRGVRSCCVARVYAPYQGPVGVQEEFSAPRCPRPRR